MGKSFQEVLKELEPKRTFDDLLMDIAAWRLEVEYELQQYDRLLVSKS